MKDEIWMNPAGVESLIQGLAEDLRRLLLTEDIDRPLVVGIHRGGVWVAERLIGLLDIEDPLGTLDIGFYRDDFSRIGLDPEVRPSRLPLSIDGRTLILVDDVLQTGRTVRAALQALFDFGRPARVLLAVLVERGGRELPIQADLSGMKAEIPAADRIRLRRPLPGSDLLELRLLRP